jgi:xanthine dehydrogenase accessory factor
MRLWKFIHSKISQNKTVYLLTVLQHKGSSPGRQGFKMAVADDTEICGSIGGGLMEFNLVELSKELLQKKEATVFCKHQIHRGFIEDGSGMICSGEQTVIFYPLNTSHILTIEKILDTYTNTKSGVLSLSPTAFDYVTNDELSTIFSHTHNSKTDWSYKEFINKKDIVYIIGAGHVGLATSKLLKQIGFKVIVYDNRENLNTFEENSYADKKQVIDFKAIANSIEEGSNVYVAIMTYGFKGDKIVLSALLDKKLKFLGVLGSKAKLKIMFDVLAKEGYDQNLLDKVYAPIGISIKSKTPEEIAVSVAAQLIKVKNTE